MPYRAESCDVAMNDLLAVAARGRQRASRQLRETQRREERAEEKGQRAAVREAHKEQQRAFARMARSTTRAGVLARPSWLGWWYMLAFNCAALLVPLVSICGWFWSLWVISALMVLPLVVWSLARLLARRSLNRERRWHAGLPFQVADYLDLLAAPGSSKLVASMTFERHPPESELVRDLLSAHDLLEPGATPWRRGRQVVFPVPENGGQPGAHDNHGYRNWVHGLVQVVHRLHRVYPVREISFTSQR